MPMYDITITVIARAIAGLKMDRSIHLFIIRQSAFSLGVTRYISSPMYVMC